MITRPHSILLDAGALSALAAAERRLQAWATVVRRTDSVLYASTATLAEKVRGRVHVLIIMAIMPSENTVPLLAALKQRFPSPHLFYWTEPVTDFGDFT